ncbi:polyprenyl synthetase family protein [Georgenia muralis]|uniref:Geranylgeranyl diphosphate synthase type II n=1 Tax=Georgenia muralis TaxID=154117 RepID=A0A3N4Z207_9MICO|nr:polyprenyl synthetase family protein [Georgenia muralis]RPF25646.1 geranylgeranyl diphosphate synthase type II [Georgenia muralis]
MNAVDAVLEAHLRRDSGSLGPEYARLWAALGDAAEGGKRFRPALVAAMYRSLGGGDDELATRVGAAVELLHCAFVIHDDVIDGDDTRRGRPNVSGTFYAAARRAGAADGPARGYADTAGILAGDLALAAAVRAMATCGAAPAVTTRLLDLMDEALHVTAAGELADVHLSLDLAPVSLGEVLTMEERKTAVYSFELPLQAGAVLAGAPEPLVAGLAELGRLVGISFQLLDDLQGVFGSEDLTGKSVLADLREGKHTPLMAHARTTAAWPRIAAYVGDPDLTEAHAGEVRELLTTCGSRTFIEDLAEDYVSAALGLAADLGVADDVVAHLTALTDQLVRRAA